MVFEDEDGEYVSSLTASGPFTVIISIKVCPKLEAMPAYRIQEMMTQ